MGEDYVNFHVSLPVFLYLQLENSANETKVTKNELIINAINWHLINSSKDFDPQKNARFTNPYN